MKSYIYLDLGASSRSGEMSNGRYLTGHALGTKWRCCMMTMNPTKFFRMSGNTEETSMQDGQSTVMYGKHSKSEGRNELEKVSQTCIDLRQTENNHF